MRVIALVKNPEHVCCRYRVSAFQAQLARAGHDIDIRSWPGFWPTRLLLYQALRRADVLLVQRKLLPAWQLRLARRRVRWLVYDYDDAIFLRDSYHANGHDSPSRLHRFDEMLRQADVIVAGNDYLRTQAVAVADPTRVHVVPTCVDLNRYHPAEHRGRKPLVQMVWVGTSSTIKGLERIAPVLEELGKNAAQLQLKVICDRSLTLQHLPVAFCPWREANEAREIAAADIGISWLPNDPWSRGKCGLKILQYMAAGLPVVANPVGVQAEMVRHGETGYLVETAAEWQQAICRLAADPGLRRAMGRAAREVIATKYDVAIGARRWQDLLDGLQAKKLARAPWRNVLNGLTRERVVARGLTR